MSSRLWQEGPSRRVEFEFIRIHYVVLDRTTDYVNSGRIEDVKEWSANLDLGLPLGIAPDRTASEAYDVRMVPITILIDRDGSIAKRLFGFKDEQTLGLEISKLIINQKA
ncbi:MAG: hypothetical protein IIC89_01435 [Chloroflexi bacterium]|nr:hypothetical protein [Chloroflexota bacterium]